MSASQGATSAVSELVLFFRRCGVTGWAKRYAAIQSALEHGDLNRAIDLEANIPKGGMGGLYDLYICKENGHSTANPDSDNDLLNKLLDSVSQEFAALRRRVKNDG